MGDKKKNILIVADELNDLREIKDQLENLGYDVPAMPVSGEDALIAIKSFRPDLLLIDIDLKGKISGIDAAQSAHNIYDIPVIYLIANAEKGTVEKIKHTEPCGIINKPVKIEILHAIVETNLYKHQIGKQVKECQARFAAALNSIGDAVITTDMNSVITSINPAACMLTGWEEDEARGKKLPDIFHIVHYHTGKTEANPVAKVLKMGKAVSLDNDTILISREGREYKIADSASPVRDRNGTVLGAVLVFRDVTDEYNTREILYRTKEELEAVFHSGPAMICYKDDKGKIIRVNQRFADAIGKSREEIFGKNIDEACPDFSGKLKKYDREILKNGKAISGIDIQYNSPRGIEWLHSDLFPYKDKNGKTIGVMTFTLDITEAKQAEDALCKSEEKYRLISENIPVAVYSALADEKSTSLFVSDNILEITGYSSIDFMKNIDLWSSIIHPEDRCFVWDTIDEHRRNKSTLDIEYRIITSEGGSRWIRDKARPLLDADGEIINVHGFLEDITDRKKTEDALLESEKLFRTVIENLPGEVFTHDLDGRIILVNRAACRNTGWTREELLSMSVGEIDPESITRKDRELLWEKLNNGDFSILSSTHIRKDGSTYPAEIYVNAVTIGGRPAILAISFDIAERKRAEELIQRDLKEKEIMLKEIHHRVKNNLTVISSLLNLQSKSITSKDDAIAAFEKSRDRIYSMARIHESLYKTEDFTRINMRKYIQTISNSLSHIYDPSGRVCLEIECENVLLDVTASIPCGLMLNELITNSLKHAFPDEQRGRIIVSMVFEDGSVYVLTVRDTGAGLPENLNIKKTGTMGMVLIRLLTEQLGGSLDIGKKPGSEFIIRFPATRAQ